MKYDEGKDTITMAVSGREFRAHMGIVGISPDGYVSDGYDSGLSIDGPYDYSAEGTSCADDTMTDAEKVELADAMIQRWMIYRNKASRGSEKPASFTEPDGTTVYYTRQPQPRFP